MGEYYQSLSESLYIEPHSGIQSGSPSKAQLRRALKSLERSGAIRIQSDDYALIIQCLFSVWDHSVKNQTVIKASREQGPLILPTTPLKSGVETTCSEKTVTNRSHKPVIPQENQYLFYLSQQFEKFWVLYPEKKSKQDAWLAFQRIGPDEQLTDIILQSVEAQIQHRECLQQHGLWTPRWKYPATWLEKKCWEDELTMNMTQENQRAKSWKNTGKEPSRDMFWIPNESDVTDEIVESNIIEFKRYSSSS